MIEAGVCLRREYPREVGKHDLSSRAPASRPVNARRQLLLSVNPSSSLNARLHHQQL